MEYDSLNDEMAEGEHNGFTSESYTQSTAIFSYSRSLAAKVVGQSVSENEEGYLCVRSSNSLLVKYSILFSVGAWPSKDKSSRSYRSQDSVRASKASHSLKVVIFVDPVFAGALA